MFFRKKNKGACAPSDENEITPLNEGHGVAREDIQEIKEQVAKENMPTVEEDDLEEDPKDTFSVLCIAYPAGMHLQYTNQNQYVKEYWNFDPEIPILLILTGTRQVIQDHIEVLKGHQFDAWEPNTSPKAVYYLVKGMPEMPSEIGDRFLELQRFTVSVNSTNIVTGSLSDEGNIQSGGYLHVNENQHKFLIGHDQKYNVGKILDAVSKTNVTDEWLTISENQEIKVVDAYTVFSGSVPDERPLYTAIMCARLALYDFNEAVRPEGEIGGVRIKTKPNTAFNKIFIREVYSIAPPDPEIDQKTVKGDWHYLDRMICSTNQFPTQLMVYLPDEDSLIYQGIWREKLMEYFYRLPDRFTNASFFVTEAPHDLSKIKEAYKDLHVANLWIRKIYIQDDWPTGGMDVTVELPTNQLVLLTLPEIDEFDIYR